MDIHLISSATTSRTISSFVKSHNHYATLLPSKEHSVRPCSLNSGSLGFTCQVLDEMPLSDTFAWNQLIHAHLTDKEPLPALSVYIHMLLRGALPDRRTLPRVLKASRLSTNLSLGKQIHGQALKLGFSSDQYVISSLIDMYGHLHSTESAKWLFDHSPPGNSVSGTVLARLYLLQNKPHLAVSTFYQMLNFGSQIDPPALATAIAACGMLKSLQHGRYVHGIAMKFGLDSDLLVSNSLLQMYIHCDCIEDARKTFDQMPLKDVISWTEIIGGYASIGGFNEALKLFRQMTVAGIKPDSLSICSILPACARPAAHKHGKEVHAYLLRNGMNLNVAVQNAVMDMYVKSGFLECASQIFVGMKERDVISWTVMMLGFSLHGQGEVGVELFRKLEKDPTIEIDQFTYAAVLHCCTSACMVEEGKLYFDCIKEPNVTHYALMVALLARASLFDNAIGFIEEHQIGGSGEAWRAVLDGCQIHQQVKTAKQVIEQLCELEPFNAENYVLLSNWYAASRKWEMVDKLKQKIKDTGLKTKKAYSWIESRNKVHTFATEDVSHPKSERIYREMQRLMKQMEVETLKVASLFSLHELEEERESSNHSEMLALCFGLISMPTGTTIRVVKNHGVCKSCHHSAKIISKLVEREIIIKDSNCFHHFKDGICSCRDFWLALTELRGLAHEYTHVYQILGPQKILGQTGGARISFEIKCMLIKIMFGWRSGGSKPSNAMSIVELSVHMDCQGCEKRIRRAISKMQGVDSLEIDMDKQKVTVTGYVEQRKVLKVVRRTGRKAEFWPFPYDSEYYPYAAQYLDESTYTTSYNYYRHGFNENVHGYFPDQAYETVSDNTVHLFSEDNVHAYCTIM
ncbi:putative pentatricopeptide repeat-containing protein At3g11460, mitochondrial [Mercurialis annua]|uniref:putative pentatricopeptide repeat-containing protein At3g11460, mitochondrial n=1 Tax=Mercurialis annua TaxID=3986 RepID=UPI0024AD1AE9|nr:putative pentatricopeptide repeat-containing protein At3g11460, mitochondrial [Mercurialis annua]